MFPSVNVLNVLNVWLKVGFSVLSVARVSVRVPISTVLRVWASVWSVDSIRVSLRVKVSVLSVDNVKVSWRLTLSFSVKVLRASWLSVLRVDSVSPFKARVLRVRVCITRFLRYSRWNRGLDCWHFLSARLLGNICSKSFLNSQLRSWTGEGAWWDFLLSQPMVWASRAAYSKLLSLDRLTSRANGSFVSLRANKSSEEHARRPMSRLRENASQTVPSEPCIWWCMDSRFHNIAICLSVLRKNSKCRVVKAREITWGTRKRDVQYGDSALVGTRDLKYCPNMRRPDYGPRTLNFLRMLNFSYD